MLWLAVRAGLQWREARAPRAPALPLETVTTVGGTSELLWLGLAGLVALAALVWGVRRLKHPGRLGLLAWLLLWLGGSVALLERELNRWDLQTASPVEARVLASRAVAPSPRAVGGTRLYLQVDGLVSPHSVLSDDPRLAGLRPGDGLSLDLTPGRFHGWFVTGWRLPVATPSPMPATVR